MERKTKQRILGILVMVGLVVILLPFFQSTKELPMETATVKAPPFPDQPVQLTSANALNMMQPSEVQPPETVQVANNRSADTINEQPDDTIPVMRPSIMATPEANQANNEPVPAVQKEVKEEAIKNTADAHTRLVDASNKLDTKPVSAKKPSHITQRLALSKNMRVIQGPIDENGLAKLKDAAWVIQIGSFKDKANALRLVNQLRAGGYQAFIQQVSTTFGSSTRVFVGPEAKHDSARELASRLESDMHIKGIIISYKPLAL